MSEANLPRKRVGNAEREHVAEILHAAFTDGQLSVTEFDERTREAWGATYADELVPLTADLSPTDRSIPPEVPQSHSEALSHISQEPGGSGISFSLMGGIDRRGDWHVASKHTSFTLMGGNVLDLRHARLSGKETVINAYACMGGIQIIVPDDVRVVDNGVGFLGGFGVVNGRSSARRMDQLPADAPVVRVRGLAFMGGVEIRRAAREEEL